MEWALQSVKEENSRRAKLREQEYYNRRSQLIASLGVLDTHVATQKASEVESLALLEKETRQFEQAREELLDARHQCELLNEHCMAIKVEHESLQQQHGRLGDSIGAKELELLQVNDIKLNLKQQVVDTLSKIRKGHSYCAELDKQIEVRLARPTCRGATKSKSSQKQIHSYSARLSPALRY